MFNMNYKKIIIFVVLALCLSGWFFAPRDVITVVYSSDSHANLYPCDCPKQRDGGLARRSTLVKKIRNRFPQVILIEGGSFFGGGPFDENSVSKELDKKRTNFFLDCIDKIGYDCLTLGEDEFIYGNDFLRNMISQHKTPFVCTNVSEMGISPYIIKTVQGYKVAIVSLCKKTSNQELKFYEWQDILKDYIDKLESMQSVDIIILVSRLSEKENKAIVDNFPQIDLLLAAFDYSRPRSFEKYNDSLIVYPVFEGRRLIKIELIVKEGTMERFKVNNLRLSDKVKADDDINSIIPQCFSFRDCSKTAALAECQNPGTLKARCVYRDSQVTTLNVVAPDKCFTCDTSASLFFIDRYFDERFRPKKIKSSSRKGKDMIANLGLKRLPAFIFGKDIEKSQKFDKIREHLVKIQGNYLVKQDLIGANYYLDRREISGKLDLFIRIFDEDSYHYLSVAQTLSESLGKKFNVYFLPSDDEQYIKEILSLLAVKKYFPGRFWLYSLDRAKNYLVKSSKATFQELEIDEAFIKDFTQSQKALKMKDAHFSFYKGLDINNSGTFLLNNREIFQMKLGDGVERIQTILKGKRR